MPAVTISAGYGAGGSVIARRLAERLGVPLLDRAISAQVAEELHVTTEEAVDAKLRRGAVERFFAVLAPLAGGVIDDTAGVPATDVGEAAVFREQADKLLRAGVRDGAVILGRGGAAALHDEPDVLRVRLFGPADRRAAQAARIEGISLEEAARRLAQVDRARAHYVARLYGRDIDDPELYHLHLDSTVIPRECCVELIALARESVAVPAHPA